MGPMRIVLFEVTEPWEREYLERRLPAARPQFVGKPLSAETVDAAAEAEAVSIFIHSRVDSTALERMPELRLVTTRSTGYDHIDVAACERRNVAVANVPRYGENTVAEHTFGLILNLSRRVHKAQARTREGNFSLSGLEGFDLRGRTLGVIGAGNIGLHVVRIARAFGMDVLAFDVVEQPLLAEVLGFRYTGLDEMLRTSDVVSLHAPLTDATRHLMNRERFAAMCRGALLVNTARGALVDTDALLWALDEGILAGAALDVLEGEELLAEEAHLFRTRPSEETLRRLLGNHLLIERDDVIVTPHMAWFSRDARERILDTTVETLIAFAGDRPVNVVSEP